MNKGRPKIASINLLSQDWLRGNQENLTSDQIELFGRSSFTDELDKIGKETIQIPSW